MLRFLLAWRFGDSEITPSYQDIISAKLIRLNCKYVILGATNENFILQRLLIEVNSADYFSGPKGMGFWMEMVKLEEKFHRERGLELWGSDGAAASIGHVKP